MKADSALEELRELAQKLQNLFAIRASLQPREFKGMIVDPRIKNSEIEAAIAEIRKRMEAVAQELHNYRLKKYTEQFLARIEHELKEQELRRRDKLSPEALVERYQLMLDHQIIVGQHYWAVPISQGDKALGRIELRLDDWGYGRLTDEETTYAETLIGQAAGAVHAVARRNESSIQIILEIDGEESGILSPRFLATTINPFLNAISDIQHVIDEILDREPREVQITSIAQFSPISIGLEGAAEAVQVVQDAIVPWRRKHTEVMAQLEEQDKLADIENKKAEILERRASAAKNRAEADKLDAEAAAKREEAAKMRLENEKLRLDLQRARIQLVLDILNQLSPNLPETERITYLVKLLPPLDIVIASNLEIVTNTEKKEDG